MSGDLLINLFTWLAILSAVSLVLALAGLPVLLLALPEDYFADDRHRDHPVRKGLPGMVMVALKNALGFVLLAAGILMLVLPGQGLLTILGGLLLMNFPGKYQLERRLIAMPRIARAVNWIRKKGGKTPFVVNPD